jgi:hypothetical protein
MRVPPTSKEEEFRRRAHECHRLALHAPSVDTKQFYLDLAQHWIFLADHTAKHPG